MRVYAIKRVLGIIPTIFVIISISFAMLHLAPGDPFSSERPIPPEVRANLEAKYGLDKAPVIQYFNYVGRLLHGDLGLSIFYKDYTVTEYIFKSLPTSITLGGLAMILALSLGITVGVLAALFKNTYIDYTLMGIAIIGISIPLFVIGPLLQYVFALKLGLLPTSGWLSSINGWSAVIMPVVTLAFIYFAEIARITRGSMLEVLKSDYIRTARAKGLSTRAVVVRHTLKGGLLPIVSFLGPTMASILTGSIVIEQIFRVPGIGRYFVESALHRDYFLLLGIVVVYASLLVVFNLVVDLLYVFLDPRIDYK